MIAVGRPAQPRQPWRSGPESYLLRSLYLQNETDTESGTAPLQMLLETRAHGRPSWHSAAAMEVILRVSLSGAKSVRCQAKSSSSVIWTESPSCARMRPVSVAALLGCAADGTCCHWTRLNRKSSRPRPLAPFIETTRPERCSRCLRSLPLGSRRVNTKRG